MKKIVHLSAVIFLLLTNIAAYATVRFELINKSSQAIWIYGEANNVTFAGASYSHKRKVSPGESYSTDISNGVMELTITPIDPNSRTSSLHQFRKYETLLSANDKDKIFVWNHTGDPKAPLYPTSSRIMGLFKTKQPNNVDIKELKLTAGSGNLIDVAAPQ